MLSPDRLEFAKKHVSEGVFFRTSIQSWGGFINRLVSPEFSQDEFTKGFGKFDGQVVFSRRYRIPELDRVRRKAKRIRIILYFAACSTKYGHYLHSSKAPEVFGEIMRVGAEMDALNKIFIENYDAIKQRSLEQYMPVIYNLWTDWFKYPGQPTVNFIEDELRRREKAFPSKERIQSMFKFDMLFSDPLLSVDGPYASVTDIEAHRMIVYREFFDAVLKKRCYLAGMSIKFKNLLGTPKAATFYQSLLNKVVAYRRGLFYADDELSRLLEALQDRLIVSNEARNPGTLCPLLDQIVNHLVKDPFFRIEVKLDRSI